MSFGILAINESGSTQIDSGLTQYQVLEYGTFTTQKVWTSSWPDKTLLFVKPASAEDRDSSHICLATTFRLGSTTYTNAGHAASGVSLTDPMDYVAVVPVNDYGSYPAAVSYNYALTIRNSSNQVSFTSEIPVLKVRSNRSIQLQNSGWDTQWYQGTTYGELFNLYFLADGYGHYKTVVSGPQADLTKQTIYRVAKYDYGNNTFGTDTITVTSTGTGSAFTRTYTGYKTEVIGIPI